MGLRSFFKRVLDVRLADSYPPAIDAEFDPDGDPEETLQAPASALRFRVRVPEVAATADSPKREAAVYYVYGQTQEEAVARLPAALLGTATVEPAGSIEGGVLVLPEDEVRSEVFDGRAAPGN